MQTCHQERRRKPRPVATGFWDLTSFDYPKLDSYAKERMLREVRSGVMTLGLVFLLLLSCAALLQSFLSSSPYLYTYLILAFLAIHVHFSSRTIRDIKALYLLGMTLLVVSSTALVLQTHQVGSLGIPIYLGVTLILVVVPLVPWGLREAVIIVALIYLVVTGSTLSAAWKFSSETLLLLQFFMLSTGMIVLLLVARAAKLRKEEIRSHFELERAHDEMRKLSYLDPLTGAFNRRYLHEEYLNEVLRHHTAERPTFFLLFDVNRFKQINDTHGHDHGDQVLIWIVDAIQESLNPEDIFVRMGGDEFAILSALDPEDRLQKSISKLHKKQAEAGWTDPDFVAISSGIIQVPQQQVPISFNIIYKTADKLLYAAKERGDNCVERRAISEPVLAPAS